jgi:hypothetical protein
VTSTRTLQSRAMKATCSGLSSGFIGTNTPPRTMPQSEKYGMAPTPQAVEDPLRRAIVSPKKSPTLRMRQRPCCPCARAAVLAHTAAGVQARCCAGKTGQ